MLQIGTSELAERLYNAWRTYEIEHMAALMRARNILITWHIPDPDVWRDLNPTQQRQWKVIAEAAGKAVSDALT